MASSRLNLARRPFVDTRPVNVTLAVLAVAAIALTYTSVGTVRTYYAQSARTRTAIASLKDDLAKLDARRAAREAVIARYDIGGLAASARDANAIWRQKAFSWTRFLSRLERTLPPDDRVAGIALSRPDAKALEAGAEAYALALTLVSKDSEALPKAIRAFYASPWFDLPVPRNETSPEKDKGAGWRIILDVTYLDRGKK